MKVLIADDEINIILLIKSLIDRQKTAVSYTHLTLPTNSRV